ncbi:MAG: enoyl-CoA hydratase-related protein [Bacteroidia bacterium]|nr:enoyl-CoA hydratase-related protein [Bacteroidia bacterium]MDW8158701.1 enoyl-CoA hydratase-related protein [Bacteroidia bacterium]
MFNTLIYQADGGVATIQFNRPEVYNAFNNEMSFEFIDALKKARNDKEIKVIIITGVGKAFCSGQDLKDVKGVTRSLGESVAKRYNPMTDLIMNIEKPVIAKVNGVAAGAGAGIVLAADIAVAAESASIVFAFANIGLVLDSGSSYNLPRLVGKRKAFELATLTDRVSAAEALSLGLVNKVVPYDMLDQTVNEIAQRYLERAPLSIGLIKRMLNRSFHSSLQEMLELEMYCQEIAGNSEDYKEGVAAFIEKRKPHFTGK